MNPLPRGKNTVKRNSETRIPRKSSENRRLFTRANLVVRLVLPSKPGQVQGNWLFHFSSFLTFRFCCSFGSFSLSDMSLKEAWVNFFLVMATGPWRTPQSYAESKKTDVSSHNFVMQVMAGSGMSDLFAQDLDLSIGKLTRAYFLQQILDIDVSCWMRQVNISILKHANMSMSSTPQQVIVMKSLADDLVSIRAFHPQHDKVCRSREWFLFLSCLLWVRIWIDWLMLLLLQYKTRKWPSRFVGIDWCCC